jgi:nucleotide-binding universal stress UspA family protein
VFERLLVPLDGSSLAEAVLPVVERFALAFGARVVLLHVVERHAPASVHGDRHFTGSAEAEAYLTGLVRDLAGRGVRAVAHVHEDAEPDVAASIAAHAAEGQANLVVLCTHGRGGVRAFLWGGIAQQVLRRGTAPVLLVRTGAPGAEAVPFAPGTILVPIDATAASEAALEPATAVARKFGAPLHVAMVVETMNTLRGDRRAASLVLPSATRRVLDVEEGQARAYLSTLADRLRGEGVVVDTEVRRGDAAEQLAGEATEHKVGLVVAATHGRAGLQAIWAGSTIARLLGRTRAPVLLLRTVED